MKLRQRVQRFVVRRLSESNLRESLLDRFYAQNPPERRRKKRGHSFFITRFIYPDLAEFSNQVLFSPSID